MADDGPGFFASAFCFFLFASSIYTLWRVLYGAGHLTGIYFTWKRNKQPNTAIEQAVGIICDDIVKSAEKNTETKWVVRPVKHPGYDKRYEIWRLDRKVKIRNFKDPECIHIDIGGVGEYNGNRIKPALRKELSDICTQYQQLTAVERILG